MTIFYTTFIRFPTEKAHGKQIKEVCNALVVRVPVTLVVPRRRTPIDPTSIGLDPKVRVVRLPLIDLVPTGTKVGYFFSLMQFVIFSALYLSIQRIKSSQLRVITRDYWSAVLPRLFGIPTAWETHRGQWNHLISFIARLDVHFFVISNGLKDLYLSKGVPENQITLVPDGVDLSRYENLPSRTEARQKLGLDPDKLIAVYNGHLHTWKGADTLAKATKLFPENAEVVFMGGTDEDIEAFKEKYGTDPRISIIGRKDDTERPIYLRAADVLILPNTAKNEISVKYTSPLKLFGYMASGVPIVASDLPSIREVVSEEEVFFAEPDNPESFAEVILYVHHNPEEALRRAQNARKLVEGFSWDVRAAKVIEVLKNVSHYKEG